MKVATQISTQILDLTNRRRQEEEDLIFNEKLLWWSEKTEQEKHMLTLSMEEIKSTLLMATFAFDEGYLIGAAGIFLPRTWNQSEPYFKGRKVVEIGTNFVLPEYRNQGIGTQLIEERLIFAKKQNWVPVSISSNEIVQKAFVRLGGSLMEDDPEHYADLIDQLCLRCTTKKDECSCCPLAANCAWIFLNNPHD